MYGVVLMAALATSSSAPDFGFGSWPGWNAPIPVSGSYPGVGWGCAPFCGWSGPAWYSGYGCGAWYSCGWCGWCCPWFGGSNGGYSYGYGVAVANNPCWYPYGSFVPPVPPATIIPGARPPEPLPPPKTKDEQARANVRIELPSDAKLYVEGVLMKTESAVRLFETPELAANRTYHYDLKAVIVRDNQTFTDTKAITVRRGELSTASFAGMEQRATAALQATQATTAQR